MQLCLNKADFQSELTIQPVISSTKRRKYGIIRENNGEGRLLLIGWLRKKS